MTTEAGDPGEIEDRDEARRIVKGAVDRLLAVALGTPGNHPLSMERVLEEFKNTVLPALHEYRARSRRRIEQKTR